MTVSPYFQILEIHSFHHLISSITSEANSADNLIVFDNFFFLQWTIFTIKYSKAAFIISYSCKQYQTRSKHCSLTRKYSLPCNYLGQNKRVLYVDMGNSWYSSLRCLNQSFFFKEKGVVLILLLHDHHALCDVVAKRFVLNTLI